MTHVLDRAAAHAAQFLETVQKQPIATTASTKSCARASPSLFPKTAWRPRRSSMSSSAMSRAEFSVPSNARFFGWVIGGTSAGRDRGRLAHLRLGSERRLERHRARGSVVEEVCGEWMKELLGIPQTASFRLRHGLPDGAHHRLGGRAPQAPCTIAAGTSRRRASPERRRLRILTTQNRHESILRSARLLGIGTEAIDYVRGRQLGPHRDRQLEEALRAAGRDPVVVWLQAGDLNTGVFDPFARACPIAHAAKAWVHIDGAFGLWAATSDRYRHLLDGAEQADSWATDGHKWLNLPFESGLVFVAHPAAHRAAFAQDTSYAMPARRAPQSERLESRMVEARSRLSGLCGDPRARARRSSRDRGTLLRPCRAARQRHRRAPWRRARRRPDHQPGTGALPRR